MLASASPGRDGSGVGHAGFSSKATMRSFSSTAITPSPQASPNGTSMQPTVSSAPRSTCSCNITE